MYPCGSGVLSDCSGHQPFFWKWKTPFHTVYSGKHPYPSAILGLPERSQEYIRSKKSWNQMSWYIHLIIIICNNNHSKWILFLLSSWIWSPTRAHAGFQGSIQYILLQSMSWLYCNWIKVYELQISLCLRHTHTTYLKCLVCFFYVFNFQFGSEYKTQTSVTKETDPFQEWIHSVALISGVT